MQCMSQRYAVCLDDSEAIIWQEDNCRDTAPDPIWPLDGLLALFQKESGQRRTFLHSFFSLRVNKTCINVH